MQCQKKGKLSENVENRIENRGIAVIGTGKEIISRVEFLEK